MNRLCDTSSGSGADILCHDDFRVNGEEWEGAVHPVSSKAAWVWIDDGEAYGRSTRFLRFSIDFESADNDLLRFYITADQRFQLLFDDRPITYGPDRSDLMHWRVTCCEIPVSAGSHRLEALVWWLREDTMEFRGDPKLFWKPGQKMAPNPPMAQTSWRGGFLFEAEGDWAEKLSTGRGPWRVQDLTPSVQMFRKHSLGYHDIGPGFKIDVSGWECRTGAQPVKLIVPAENPNVHGLRRPGWVLCDHELPEQCRRYFAGGKIRAVRSSVDEYAFCEEEQDQSEVLQWNELLSAQKELHVGPHKDVTVLWDFETYQCGYPALSWSGGTGSSIEVEWAESLYKGIHSSEITAGTSKGRRNSVAGKAWLGFGDTYIAGGSDEQCPAIWWRSGRYVRLRIRTHEKPLVIRSLQILKTGYPLEVSSTWDSSDEEWNNVLPILRNSLQNSAHETWVDSPHYEQMMYTGDTRLHGLSNYTCCRDDSLSRYALKLFDWSRSTSQFGLVAGRYPSAWPLEISSYALIWIWMVRDFLFWRDDLELVACRLNGIRELLNRFDSLRRKDGTLGVLPGWPFVDWVDLWDEGCGPGARQGDSSILNLHLVLALQAAADVERAVGEDEIAIRRETDAGRLMERIVSRYWNQQNGVFTDTPGSELFSEHAQVLALLTGRLDANTEQACLKALRAGICAAKCSIYFSHYLLEAFYQYGCDDLFFERLKFWRDLLPQGFVALPESPEPARSDCHGWGAHPLFHSYASIAGIRPSAPGFSKVRVAPMPGNIENISLQMPHPKGEIRFRCEQREERIAFTVTLPDGVSGEFIWMKHQYEILDTREFVFNRKELYGHDPKKE